MVFIKRNFSVSFRFFEWLYFESSLDFDVNPLDANYENQYNVLLESKIILLTINQRYKIESREVYINVTIYIPYSLFLKYFILHFDKQNFPVSMNKLQTV